MKLRTISLGVASALALGASAFALEGSYTSGETTLTFNADGTYSVIVQGATIPGTFTVDGDKVTVKHPAEADQFCMGAEGVYTVVETDADATFTTVNDPCTQRATAMAATWTKKAAE
jgi:hypothetical protein